MFQHILIVNQDHKILSYHVPTMHIMNIPLLLFYIGLLTPFGTTAQALVSGKVIDAESEAPLVGAQVIVNADIGAVTNREGLFKIKLAPGTYVAQVTYLGYKDKTIPIKTSNPELGTIALQLYNTTLPEVIVSSSPKSYRKDIKGSNFRINPLTLKNSNPISTEEVLKTVPGVNIVGDMGLSNRPNISIRGSWGRRSKKVLLMEDGSPSAPAPYIAPGAYYNPVSDRITAIEVYKGADMLRFGPNNMYGAINYITALPPQKPELRVKLVGGQRDYTTGLLSYGGTWKNLGALIEGVYKKFDGFTDHSGVELLNLNAKIFAKLSDTQSLYFKVSGQFEDNQASLSSITPFTFRADPEQNPLDADQFTMRRYGMDIIHKWLPNTNTSITSKLYASDFERDWWRQTTVKIRAAEVRDYVGTAIYEDRYSYLEGVDVTEEDYVIVGRVENGNESTTDSRWAYTVSGIKETLGIDWNAFGQGQYFETSLNVHRETFKDRFLEATNSRWARHGDITTDLWYRLWSLNGFIRNDFTIGNWGVTPIIRWEHVDMFRQNLVVAAQNTALQGTEDGREFNVYDQLLPGITVDYNVGKGGEVFASIYEGMIAPSKVFGFLVEQNGTVTNPFIGASINIKPELSWNREIGWRGQLFENRLNGQLAYFNNTSRNFYAGGRNEVFETLGKINVNGLEAALSAEVLRSTSDHLTLYGNMTLLRSKVLEGKLWDKDLFSQIVHNVATRSEFIDKVNTYREAYELYIPDGNGGEMLLTSPVINSSDFENLTKSVVNLGDGGIPETEAPYTPSLSMNAGVNYSHKGISLGVGGHYVGTQYTEFNNFENESGDGAIGKLPAYFTLDAFLRHEFDLGPSAQLDIFLNGKNLSNKIYRASRLNRATSGVFPGGFRQVILGANLTL